MIAEPEDKFWTTQQPPSTTAVNPPRRFRKDVPLVGRKGAPITQYPVRTFLEKLKLWHKTTNVEDEMVGPLIAGRLHGRASKVAVSLRAPRPDGRYGVGVGCAWAWYWARCQVRRSHSYFGQRGQDLACNQCTRALLLPATHFIQSWAGQRASSNRVTLAAYAVDTEARSDEASGRAGVNLNDIGRVYVWFKPSGLPAKTVGDITLQVNATTAGFKMRERWHCA